jgi:hypothetical protein
LRRVKSQAAFFFEGKRQKGYRNTKEEKADEKKTNPHDGIHHSPFVFRVVIGPISGCKKTP